MSDRSDEVTASREREEPATDDLLEKTDHLLSETGVDAGESRSGGTSHGPSAATDADDRRVLGSETGRERDTDADRGGESAGGSSRFSPTSLLSPLRSRLSPGRYFSPKEYVVLAVILGVGLLAGATALPIAGRLIGMFAAAFTVGSLASKRRYLEVSAAGVSVGGLAALFNYAVLVAAGSAGTLVAVGATVGLLASVGGYYFGRDLRAGLSRDID